MKHQDSSNKVLFLATVPSMIISFNLRNIQMLQSMGYEVHAACNFKDRSAWTQEQLDSFKDIFSQHSVVMHQVDFPRKPYHPILLRRSYCQIKKLLKKENYAMMHNQSCVSGILGRVACRKLDTKIIHTEHGFYYFKGCPAINWIYYPFDKLCSQWTEAFVTINKDDFRFAQTHMKAKSYWYIPGVGVDTSRFRNTVIDRAAMRKTWHIPSEATVILSVGELNSNKNHIVIIDAISKMNISDVYYIVCGTGVEREHLLLQAKVCGLEERVILTGNVDNVNEFCKMSDIFAFPSKREGLGLAAIEAMASGLPLVASNKNGINDYAEDGKTGFLCDPTDVDAFAESLKRLIDDSQLRRKMGEYNTEKAKEFDNIKADEIMLNMYHEVMQNDH